MKNCFTRTVSRHGQRFGLWEVDGHCKSIFDPGTYRRPNLFFQRKDRKNIASQTVVSYEPNEQYLTQSEDQAEAN
ncbi:hypothetical protein FKM82_007501 [Ascaphus truei]